MPTREVMQATVEIINDACASLNQRNTVYISPAIIPIECQANFEVQVVDGGCAYRDLEGGVRSEHFNLLVAIFTRYQLDSGQKYANQLRDINHSIFELKEKIIIALDGSFCQKTSFDDVLLTRPLRVTSENPVQTYTQFKGLLMKRLVFLGGINNVRT